MADRFRQLTDGQKECLRLVAAHHSTKEIAVALGVSPSAIDKRIERAVQILGVGSRFAAARMLAQEEQTQSGVDRLPWQTIDVPSTPAVDNSEREGGPRGFVSRLLGFEAEADALGKARNTVPKLYRLGVVFALMLLVAMTSVAMLTVGRTLADFMRAEHIDLSGR